MMLNEKKEIIPLISIVVAFFNAEAYLQQCISSIVRQTYTNIEVILIDDGSTDNSSVICKDIVSTDKRFIYLFQENKGVSSARNLGLRKANGKYISFIDADDWIEPFHIETLYSTLLDNNVDLSCVNWIRDDHLDKNSLSDNVVIYNDKNLIVAGVFDSKAYAGYVWNKLFDCTLISKNNIFFDENIKVLEDQLFVLQYCLNCSSVAFQTNATYHYRMHDTSVMNKSFGRERATSVVAMLKIITILESNEFSRECIDDKVLHASQLFRNSIKYYADIGDRDNALSNIKEMLAFIRIHKLHFLEKIKCYIMAFICMLRT